LAVAPARPDQEWSAPVTKLFTEYRNQTARLGSPERTPTAVEIQRWEDDGGAVGPEPSLRRVERRYDEPPEERAAA
jgi:hypothetical protein